jgi:hypothetical protein
MIVGGDPFLIQYLCHFQYCEVHLLDNLVILVAICLVNDSWQDLDSGSMICGGLPRTTEADLVVNDASGVSDR